LEDRLKPLTHPTYPFLNSGPPFMAAAKPPLPLTPTPLPTLGERGRGEGPIAQDPYPPRDEYGSGKALGIRPSLREPGNPPPLKFAFEFPWGQMGPWLCVPALRRVCRFEDEEATTMLDYAAGLSYFGSPGAILRLLVSKA
jgi:hypothetical protein